MAVPFYTDENLDFGVRSHVTENSSKDIIFVEIAKKENIIKGLM